METLLAILIGIGLSAAAGIRVFTPLLIYFLIKLLKKRKAVMI